MQSREDAILFSGGAQGAEAEFGRQAEMAGVAEVNFSFEGHKIERSRGLRMLTQEELMRKDHATLPEENMIVINTDDGVPYDEMMKVLDLSRGWYDKDTKEWVHAYPKTLLAGGAPGTTPDGAAVGQGVPPVEAAKDEAKAAQGGASYTPPSLDGRDSELEALRSRVAGLESSEAAVKEELSSLKDQYLRKLADDENFRKRMRREVEDSRKFANNAILVDLVSVLDDFDRAIASAEHAKDYAVLHDGVVLIRRQFGQMLANKYGLQPFQSAGKPFDPNFHEALASEPGDVGEDTVGEEFLPGYSLHERVVRSAKVKVLTPRAPAQGGGAEPGQTGLE